MTRRDIPDGGFERPPDCGKIRYSSRKYAKQAAHRIRGRHGRLNAYQCGQFWHLGHLPQRVIQGKVGRPALDRRDL